MGPLRLHLYRTIHKFGYSAVRVTFAPLSSQSFRRDVPIPTHIQEHLRWGLSLKPSRIYQALSGMEYDIVNILSPLAESSVHVHELMWHAKESFVNDVLAALSQLLSICLSFVS